jgi:hypothetical protein
MMSGPAKVLILNGSPKRGPSTSESIAEYLEHRFRQQGLTPERHVVFGSLKTEERTEELLTAVEEADLLILVSPLYVDSFPSLVVKTLESIAARRDPSMGTSQRFFAILNCGFPEARHCGIALSICKKFAEEANFRWAGGLALGGGEAISGKPLNTVRFLARNVIRSLDLTADALAKGREVPRRAVELMAKPLMPGRLYTFVGSRRWKRSAKKNRVDLRAKPFAEIS